MELNCRETEESKNKRKQAMHSSEIILSVRSIDKKLFTHTHTKTEREREQAQRTKGMNELKF